jgi:TolA-binding protein
MPVVGTELPMVIETPSRRSARAPSSGPPSPRVSPEPTAASVFAAANAARRRGEIPKAMALYESLRERFPDSSQAVLSFISVGDLLLGEGAADKAVAAYGAYLRGAPHGSLTEEALYGRARGLRLAGRTAEERQTWQELSRRFPRSAYEPTASRRLRELAP